jgi:uncharacterized membrane protein YeaQ/YmgE (transglycosylase-associated protein family)
MTIEGVILWVVIGGIVAWFVGEAIMVCDLGFAGEMAVGGAGGLLAGWFLPLVGFEVGPGIVPDVLNASLGGAMIFPIVVIIKRKYLDIE